ncbi:MAG: hypothetical protein KGL39_17310 [Patescibacteria group bacterium]|nr:hypothetical protein [Patescibacteria group bacterium]
MIPVPSNKRDLIDFSKKLIDECRISVAMRSSYYRQLNMIAETGRYDGSKALINMLNFQLTRAADYLFSPVELQFALDFGRPKRKLDYERARVVAKELTRTWDRNNTDMTFGRGVKEALKYGAAILKQWVQVEGKDEHPVYYDKLVLPWQFGVYREDENRLDRQEAICETVMLTMPEVWRRICHLDEARKLYDRIKAHAQTGTAAPGVDSNQHWVLSANPLNTSGVESTIQPGGIVQVTSQANYGIMGPIIAPEVVVMHELWVKDETDYVTIQMIEPDILIAPLHKKANLLGIDGQQPYRLIQPNEVTDWFWGRSELVDLIEPQALLSTWCEDLRRLMGLQIEKILGFTGDAGITDEIYAQMRLSGWTNLPQGADIKDITPKLPAELIPMLKFMLEVINTLGGFPEIMQGKGEPGVRAGVHADTLLKTGSPSLRDRSLLVERQLSQCADLTLQMMEAKDDEYYWTKADEAIKDVEETKFLLTELPEDWRVTVDSHSSSPIFISENQQLLFALRKLGTVGDDYLIHALPIPHKELAEVQLRDKEKKQAEMLQTLLQQDPEVGQKILQKQVGLRR